MRRQNKVRHAPCLRHTHTLYLLRSRHRHRRLTRRLLACQRGRRHLLLFTGSSHVSQLVQCFCLLGHAAVLIGNVHPAHHAPPPFLACGSRLAQKARFTSQLHVFRRACVCAALSECRTEACEKKNMFVPRVAFCIHAWAIDAHLITLLLGCCASAIFFDTIQVPFRIRSHSLRRAGHRAHW